MPHMHTSNLILKQLSCRSWVTLQKMGSILSKFRIILVLLFSKDQNCGRIFIFCSLSKIWSNSTAKDEPVDWNVCLHKITDVCLSENTFVNTKRQLCIILEQETRWGLVSFLTRSVWACVCLCTDTFVCAFPRFLHRWPLPFGTFGTQNVTFTRASQLFKA